MGQQVDEERLSRALFWATSPPSMRWHLLVEEEVQRNRLSSFAASRAHLLASVAMYEAYVAAWEAKYHFWLLRPITADAELEPLFPTPPHPSYPSGHSTISASVAVVLSAIFPQKSHEWNELAKEASDSRLWGMVHYRFDLDAGLELGRAVGTRLLSSVEGTEITF